MDSPLVGKDFYRFNLDPLNFIHSFKAADFFTWLRQYANHLRYNSEQRIFYSADTECVFYSLWQILPNKHDKKFIVSHYYQSFIDVRKKSP